MQEQDRVVTAPVETQDKPDTIEVETNIQPEIEKSTPEDAPKPAETQEQKKTRTEKRRAEKERLIRDNAEKDERLRQTQAELDKYTKPKESKKDSDDEEPKASDYEDAFEYIDAKADYRARKAIEGYEKKQTEQQKQRETERELQVKQQAYGEKLRPVLEARPDLVEKLQQYEQQGLISKNVESAVRDSEIGHKLTEYFADNPQDLAKISQLNEAQTYRVIGMLEMKLGEDAPTPARSVTKATPPISAPRNDAKTNRSINSYTQEEIENMPISEYNKISMN